MNAVNIPFYKSKKFIAMALAVVGLAVAASLKDMTWHDAAETGWKIIVAYLLMQGSVDVVDKVAQGKVDVANTMRIPLEEEDKPVADAIALGEVYQQNQDIKIGFRKYSCLGE